MNINTISVKILLWLTPFFVSILLLSTYLIDSKMQNQIRNDIQNQSNSDAKQLARMIEEYQSKALETAVYLSNNDEIKEAYRLSDDRAVEVIEDIISPIRKSIVTENNVNSYKIHFHRPPAKSLYRIWSEKRYDNLESFRHTILNVYENKKPLKAIELGKGGFAIRGLAPIIDDNNDYLGSVEMFYNPLDIIDVIIGNDTTYSAFYLVNKELATSLFLPEQIKENYANEVEGYLISKIHQSWLNPIDIIKISSVKEVNSDFKIKTEINEDIAVSYIPLKDYSGKSIGHMVFAQDISNKLVAISELIFTINIVLFVLIVVLYIALIFVIKANVSSKLKTLLKANKSLEKGQLDYFENNSAYLALVNSKSNDEIGQLVNSYNSMVYVQKEMLKKIDIFTKEIEQGNLSFKNENNLEGVYSDILTKIDNCIEVMIKPINQTTEYLENISLGILPNPILENYQGDFNKIKTALNTMINSISGLNSELEEVYEQQTSGVLSYRTSISNYSGFYSDILSKINSAFDQLDNNISESITIAIDYANGNVTKRMSDQPGELSKFSNAINGIGNSIEHLSSELNQLSYSISEGRLDIRANETQAKGEYKQILIGINKTLDSVIYPLNVTAEYVDRISKGDIPSKITDDYKGDFNEIKNNLNLCIDSLSTMINDANCFVSEISLGKLRYRVDDNHLAGDFKKIMTGLNSSMDAVVNLLDNIEAPLMSIDNEFNILFMNQTGASLNNTSGKALEGTKCYHHFKTEHCETEKCACFQTMSQNKPNKDESIARPGGLELDILYSGIPIRDKDNNAVGAFEIVFNQTDIKNQIRKTKKVSDYQTKNTESLINSLEALSNGCLDCEFIVEESEDIDILEAKSNFDKISNGLSKSIKSITNVLDSVDSFVNQAKQGNLNYRIDSRKFFGDYQRMVIGINNILENVLEPINESLKVIEQMESGNLNVFMLGNYKGDYQKLKQKQNSLITSLNQLLSEVKGLVLQVDNSTNTISSNTDALAAATLEQSSQAEEVASAIEELSATITQNAMSSLKTSDLSSENGNLAIKGGEIVQETISKMKDIAKVVSDSASQIEELGKASSKIGEIISVIDEIADQTNLLALNAAIEAARAGEQGRGFAVVADEVRKLAERTSEATKQISSMIIGVQQETQKAVDAMNKGTKEVNAGISFADNAGEALSKIVDSSGQLKDMVSQMASANEEQSATSEEISKNIGTITQVSIESAKRIEGVSILSDKLKTKTSELIQTIDKFRLSDQYDISYSSDSILKASNNKLLK